MVTGVKHLTSAGKFTQQAALDAHYVRAFAPGVNCPVSQIVVIGMKIRG